MVLSREMLTRIGDSWCSFRTPTAVRNLSPMLPLKMAACTGGIVIKVFNDSDKTGDSVVLTRGRP